MLLLLQHADVKIEPGRTPQGTHALHEDVLQELRDRENPYPPRIRMRTSARDAVRRRGVAQSVAEGPGFGPRPEEDGGRGLVGIQRKALNESLEKGKKKKKDVFGRDLAFQERRKLQGITARDRATLKREREAYNEHVERITASLDKRSAETEEERTRLTPQRNFGRSSSA